MQYVNSSSVPRHDVSYWFVGLAFWVGGIILNGYAYNSSDPIIVTLIFMVAFSMPLLVESDAAAFERKTYILVFSIMWFMAGVAAIYSNIFDDFEQNYSDAAGFYTSSIDGTHRLSLEQIGEFSVGASAIYLWGLFYDFFRSIGLGDGKYIGIAWNITAVSWTGVLAVRIAWLTFGSDPSRVNRLIIVFSSCGLFWLFASMHLRDAMGLLLVTGLIYCWVRLFVEGTLIAFMVVVSATVLLTPLLASIRPDFVYVPLGFVLSGVASSLMFSRNLSQSQQTISVLRYSAILVGLVVAIVMSGLYFDEVLEALEYRSEGYRKFAEDEAASSSLGNRYIVQASWPIRLVLGTAYLFVYPIPVWSGFQLEIVYHLFKSLNALMFYFLIPLFVLAVRRMFATKDLRTPALMFLLMSFAGFTFAVSLTSIETRHWGAFLVPMMVISVGPDLTRLAERIAYQRLLKFFVFFVVAGHLTWAALKFGI